MAPILPVKAERVQQTSLSPGEMRSENIYVYLEWFVHVECMEITWFPRENERRVARMTPAAPWGGTIASCPQCGLGAQAPGTVLV